MEAAVLLPDVPVAPGEVETIVDKPEVLEQQAREIMGVRDQVLLLFLLVVEEEQAV